MLRKIFLSPFFTLVGFTVLWLSFVSSVYHWFPEDVFRVTEEGEIIEIVTHLGYVLLIGMLLVVCDDYKDRIKSWGIFLFLAICAFLREGGIQHHLSKTDTTPFKSRFFLNPNNPLGEKLVFGLVLIVIFGAVLYLAYKYAKPLVLTFFKKDTVTWSIAVLCVVGVFSKWIDRFPANYRKAHDGVRLDESTQWMCSMLEESSEMFLPYIAIIILWQYHLLLEKD